MILLLVMACGRQAEGPAPEAGAEEVAPVVLTEVRLPLLQVERPFPRDAELRGLVTLAVELGLGDLPGVVPVVSGDALPAAFLGERAPALRQADARLSARGGADDSVELELELCVAGGECVATVASAPRKAPWPAVGALLEGAASALGVPVDEATRAAWSQPGSADDYAELMTGRAAAQLYGILPPSLTPGDKKDPVLRAVVLDPRQPLAQWVRARWEMSTTLDGGKAADALARAQLLRPTSPLLAADQAALLTLTGHPAEALLAWETLAGTGEDPRWTLPLARARLAAGHPVEAVAALDRLPTESAWDPAVAALRVRAAEAVGSVDLDPLLARWQAVASRNPEPVRRRIDARVRAGKYAEAQELAGPLRDRAPGAATDALEVALLVALGRLEEAAALAPADVAARIRARAALTADPGRVPDELAPDAPGRAGVEAEAALWRKDPQAALRAAERMTSDVPTSGVAWSLRARALEALGRVSEASAAWARAWELDPGSAGGPVEGRRVASTFRYVEQGEAEAAGPEGAPGPKGPEL